MSDSSHMQFPDHYYRETGLHFKAPWIYLVNIFTIIPVKAIIKTIDLPTLEPQHFPSRSIN